MEQTISALDLEILAKLKQVTARGRDVEVTRDRDGNLKLLEVKKTRL
jgi:hypothetical protein